MSRHQYTAAAAMALALAMTVPMTATAAEALRVVRDPSTGELRAPNAAEAAAFEKAEAQLRAARHSQSPAAKVTAPVEIRYPDGTIETKLGEDTMMYSVVKDNGDGSLTMDCLPHQQAQAFVKATKKSSRAKASTRPAHNHE